ncbi:flagellar hook-basal body complex protein FliE [Candidatus Liberibacter africanus]|uniref:Flagellar hook-basal body protein FliE n=1 Tax=Candidatus Liberibacter africanus PTSAPSY TaxID=1277257 RepID=A0A0G3I295_LIBAF|nr:flagellar hook-basal body complex protein FliE [Candidatus Liberibacter africanus]AKK19981.1 flagellar hook-basal body protein FliE [Candidatus Liberibacter africanus PTSAPSY]QTP63813.1 flagellar hook-basal body complex protein FliE [Candidatus Liberibacter africanus]
MIEQIQGPINFVSHIDAIETPPYFTNSADENSGASSISFSSLLQDMAGEAIGNIKKAEDSSFSVLQGKTSMREAADYIMQAERVLNLSIALRDKVLSAVGEVSKMQI